ncbi:hypothetical protein KC357_g183 [Hortaea werneckii]|nr:hypothetical protein KC357_g183 [Hortaea werneckii]
MVPMVAPELHQAIRSPIKRASPYWRQAGKKSHDLPFPIFRAACGRAEALCQASTIVRDVSSLGQLRNVQGREASRAHWLHSQASRATLNKVQPECAFDVPTTILVLPGIDKSSTDFLVAQRELMDETYVMNRPLHVEDFEIDDRVILVNAEQLSRN